jgi:hypothetical protein
MCVLWLISSPAPLNAFCANDTSASSINATDIGTTHVFAKKTFCHGINAANIIVSITKIKHFGCSNVGSKNVVGTNVNGKKCWWPKHG